MNTSTTNFIRIHTSAPSKTTNQVQVSYNLLQFFIGIILCISNPFIYLHFFYAAPTLHLTALSTLSSLPKMSQDMYYIKLFHLHYHYIPIYLSIVFSTTPQLDNHSTLGKAQQEVTHLERISAW